MRHSKQNLRRRLGDELHGLLAVFLKRPNRAGIPQSPTCNQWLSRGKSMLKHQLCHRSRALMKRRRLAELGDGVLVPLPKRTV